LQHLVGHRIWTREHTLGSSTVFLWILELSFR
jgi:hypothetical protein